MIKRLVEAHKFFFSHSLSYVGDVAAYRRGVKKAYLRFMWYSLKDAI